MIGSHGILPVNHVLRTESWACKWLQSYEGKTLCIHIPPLIHTKWVVLANGELGQCNDTQVADTTLSFLPTIIPGLLAHDESAYDNITISGDAMFAEDLITIAKSLKLNIEQQLGKYIGDIPAHRLAKAGESLFHWHLNLTKNLSDTIGEYWTEEQPLIVKNNSMLYFAQQIDTLQKEINQLETRIERLMQKSKT